MANYAVFVQPQEQNTACCWWQHQQRS